MKRRKEKLKKTEGLKMMMIVITLIGLAIGVKFSINMASIFFKVLTIFVSTYLSLIIGLVIALIGVQIYDEYKDNDDNN